jgi:hypothetical protein
VYSEFTSGTESVAGGAKGLGTPHTWDGAAGSSGTKLLVDLTP